MLALLALQGEFFFFLLVLVSAFVLVFVSLVSPFPSLPVFLFSIDSSEAVGSALPSFLLLSAVPFTLSLSLSLSLSLALSFSSCPSPSPRGYKARFSFHRKSSRCLRCVTFLLLAGGSRLEARGSRSFALLLSCSRALLLSCSRALLLSCSLVLLLKLCFKAFGRPELSKCFVLKHLGRLRLPRCFVLKHLEA